MQYLCMKKKPCTGTTGDVHIVGEFLFFLCLQFSPQSTIFFYFKTWCPSRWNEKLIRDVIIQKSRWTGYALVWTDKDCPSQTYCNRLLFHWAICLTVTWLDELSYAGKRTSIVVCCNEWLLLIHVCISKKKQQQQENTRLLSVRNW